MKENITIVIKIAITGWVIAKIIILNNKVNERYYNEFGLFGKNGIKQEVNMLEEEVKTINKKLRYQDVDVISLKPKYTGLIIDDSCHYNRVLKTTSRLSRGDVFKHEGIYYEVNDFLEITKDTNEIKYSCSRI